jgi:6-phosphogluconate dehydrogenase
MPGGPREAWERVKNVLEAVSAKVNGEPCVAYLGSGSSGHFVKTVHNGIEYAVMQLLAETYDLMKRGLGMGGDELRDVYVNWNKGELNSFLVEITGQIFGTIDEHTGKPLIDVLLDVAKQNGTGMWTSQSAMELQVPVPTIDFAVTMRDLSVLVKQRDQASEVFKRTVPQFTGDRKLFLERLGHALYAAMIVAYAQGMAVLASASRKYGFDLDLEVVARIWRGGCIIRAALLEDIRKAYVNQRGLDNLILAPEISQKLLANEEDLRTIVCSGIDMGVPVPCFMTALSYLDGYRSAWLPANLIQAQRDYFGAHTYSRIDVKGTFHTDWSKGLK